MTKPCKWVLMPAILIITLIAEIGHEARAAKGFSIGYPAVLLP
jgi:hypothetical protein